MFPWLVFLKRAGKRLSDIEYLAIKEFDSKLVENESTQGTGATGDLGTLTASSGKDMYLASAKCSFQAATNAGGKAQVELKVNGVIKETAVLHVVSSSGTANGKGSQSMEYEFKNIGQKVAATQIIKLEVISNTTAIVEGYVQCFEEDTGASPAV